LFGVDVICIRDLLYNGQLRKVIVGHGGGIGNDTTFLEVKGLYPSKIRVVQVRILPVPKI